jgi:hypothetical protein
MPFEEAGNVSPREVTPILGKGTQDTWRFQNFLPGLGLIKPGDNR